jgi:hypothetical protein
MFKIHIEPRVIVSPNFQEHNPINLQETPQMNYENRRSRSVHLDTNMTPIYSLVIMEISNLIVSEQV